MTAAIEIVNDQDALTKECRGCDARLLTSDPDLCETCELHADAGPFRVESWNERP
jgi:hypothetical protein